MEFMIMGIAFIAVVALVGGVFLIMRDRNPQTDNRLAQFTSRGRLTGKGGDSPDILRKAAFESDKRTLLETIIPKLPNMQKLFEQAESNIPPSTLIAVSLVLGVLGASLGWFMTRGSGALQYFVWIFPGVFMFSLPWLWLLAKRGKRLKKFSSQLPDALELLGRALRAGHSLAAAMHVVGEEMPPPISGEFARIYEEQNLGIPLEDAMRSMCDRVPNLDLRFFVTSVAIQRQTGGDLAEILDKIGYVIRERFKILGMVKALTAEGRLSGIVLIALPVLLFFMVLFLNPGYLQVLWTTDVGRIMFIGAIVMQIIGALLIKKIVTIKV